MLIGKKALIKIKYFLCILIIFLKSKKICKAIIKYKIKCIKNKVIKMKIILEKIGTTFLINYTFGILNLVHRHFHLKFHKLFHMKP